MKKIFILLVIAFVATTVKAHELSKIVITNKRDVVSELDVDKNRFRYGPFSDPGLEIYNVNGSAIASVDNTKSIEFNIVEGDVWYGTIESGALIMCFDLRDISCIKIVENMKAKLMFRVYLKGNNNFYNDFPFDESFQMTFTTYKTVGVVEAKAQGGNFISYSNETIRIIDIDVSSVKIYSFLGKVEITSTKNEINISNLPKGAYIISVNDKFAQKIYKP